ncbi:hypothetical protein [Streptomyces sp. R35]|uniref:Uncharacterized protein n=1 Tax=Streptomyces sp. R35 TaxID=3238630 RepID=A0AB39S3Y1_9ACTN
MNHPVGTEIEATAQWLEAHSAAGAATVLRRVAGQRDRSSDQLAVALNRLHRYRSAWLSARQRAQSPADQQAERLDDAAQLNHRFSQRPATSAQPEQDALRDHALMRVDLARFQNLVERAGWLPDAEPRRLWRWRNGWWELVHHKRNPKDGYHDTGWYLWGPVEGCFGEWTARQKDAALRDADRLITQHLAARAEDER